jgi:hypothetical protein
LEDSYEYYCDYAKLAGSDVRKKRKSPEVQWVFATRRVVVIVRIWRKN